MKKYAAANPLITDVTSLRSLAFLGDTTIIMRPNFRTHYFYKCHLNYMIRLKQKLVQECVLNEWIDVSLYQ